MYLMTFVAVVCGVSAACANPAGGGLGALPKTVSSVGLGVDSSPYGVPAILKSDPLTGSKVSKLSESARPDVSAGQAAGAQEGAMQLLEAAFEAHLKVCGTLAALAARALHAASGANVFGDVPSIAGSAPTPSAVTP